MSEVTASYCLKCKEQREMVNPTATYTRNGAPCVTGTCSVCGSRMTKMGRTPEHDNLPKPDPMPKAKKAGSTKKKKTTKSATKSRKATSNSRNNRKPVGKLVIVESPAKARSIGSYLGRGYTVLASKGHVRDLLVTQLSVDVENDFEPKYRVPNDKRDTVNQIKDAVNAAEEIYLATDPDREGEAIAWHLVAAADVPEDRVKRVVFHEITKSAVQNAFDHPRNIDMSLVNAQQARRILDRLVGYNITELLWDKVRNRLSAGRVQSIALRMVVDREREIESFQPEEYWTVDAELSRHDSNSAKEKFIARLIKIDDEDARFGSEDEVKPHLETLEKSAYSVIDVKTGERRRRPSAPFTTSTLQQEASRRFGFNARRTMSTAQQLYEGIEIQSGNIVGLITYMRTDSVNISAEAQQQARTYVTKNIGNEYIPAKPPTYKTRAKGAQEAHEAIRPTSVELTPDSIKSYLSRDQFKLYKLIWERFVASQMSNAVYDTMRIDIRAGLTAAPNKYLLRTSGSRLKFPGFLALYEDTRDEDVAPDEDEGRILPSLTENDALDLYKLLPEQHFTQPPPRYTEASLVRTLEEFGIGRPSTYAPTVAVIQDREYVTKQDKRLRPTDTGKIVSELLVQYFAEEMDYQFTARMEDKLDEIADNDGVWRPMLHDFYQPFESRLKHARENMPQVKQEELVGRDCPECEDGQLVIKHGRFGKFIGCSNYPECRYTEQYVEYAGIKCPTCGGTEGGDVVIKRTRRGRMFYGCSRYPECEWSAWKLPKKSGESDEGEAEVAVRDATG